MVEATSKSGRVHSQVLFHARCRDKISLSISGNEICPNSAAHACLLTCGLVNCSAEGPQTASDGRGPTEWLPSRNITKDMEVRPRPPRRTRDLSLRVFQRFSSVSAISLTKWRNILGRWRGDKFFHSSEEYQTLRFAFVHSSE